MRDLKPKSVQSNLPTSSKSKDIPHLPTTPSLITSKKTKVQTTEQTKPKRRKSKPKTLKQIVLEK